ncbi:serine/arginine repetitive matrix protein 2 [Schistocerca americana]|uniref:serine/arginine repetitive matrix protein 2 n=1 Tax=Schistocerca americana TaxID=7009 RepID=UPI001F4FB3E0|nr:serine/arginine repetitive matrix protein 2 [Schistocerca americana]
MSGSDERQARSVALERAYVHDVYEQISAATHLPGEAPRGRAWPKVKQFLAELEPGSLVCDVGCGNGKYLGVNPLVFKVGVDRCCSLAEVAREKDHEVLMCDNLSLPFRDESFDAVLSVAVVHHFATTERRVGALRELARVLRIGGRLIISVWAMEQRHRKFESQDVLVPWHRPQQLSTPSLELTSTTTTTTSEEEEGPPPYHAYTQTSDSDSCRSAGRGGPRRRGRTRHKGRSIDPAAPSSSPSSSSLSSPNETCYSFVRRALQKLAGGKRSGSSSRPWFLDSWSSCTKESPAGTGQRCCEECGQPDCAGANNDAAEDIQDLPIELRRLEEDGSGSGSGGGGGRRQTLACARRPHLAASGALAHLPPPPQLNYKSKSLSDILTVGQRGIVRSRSSVPSLAAGDCALSLSLPAGGGRASLAKPRLVKQKQSLCDDEAREEAEEGEDPSDLRDLVKALPEFKVSAGGVRRCGNVFKQSSMNEELMMSTERLREKERVRQNIQKQASLNEELIYRRHRTLDSLRDTFFSTSTAKRFQLLKNGLTSKIKSSTTGIEKVAGSSFKNGFVRILQGWKGGEARQQQPPPSPTPASGSSFDALSPRTPPPDSKKMGGVNNSNCCEASSRPGERRHSREDGSDSSKDSSLQSDTSVDSEDSFASVIYVPKPKPSLSPPKSPQPASPKQRLRQVQEMLRTRITPLASRSSGGGSSRPMFPLVRRSSTAGTGARPEPLARPLPRLLSLELFNPETDDMDSDSSGVSSPDSVSSVISVLTEEPAQPADDAAGAVRSSADSAPATSEVHPHPRTPSPPPPAPTLQPPPAPPPTLPAEDELAAPVAAAAASPSSLSLLEAAADVASSLEDAVDAVIQSSPRARRRKLDDPLALIHGWGGAGAGGSGGGSSATGSRRVSPRREAPSAPAATGWPAEGGDESCRQHLADFAEKLSEKLLEEIDQYRAERSRPASPPPPLPPRPGSPPPPPPPVEAFLPPGAAAYRDDPYLSRLSEELHDLSRLSEELHERNSFIASLNESSDRRILEDLKNFSWEASRRHRSATLAGTPEADGRREGAAPEPETRRRDGGPVSEDVALESYSRQTSADLTDELEDEEEELRSGLSLESSSDASDGLPTASTASLSDGSGGRGRVGGASSSEEALPPPPPPEDLPKTESCASSLSGSTSQESLPSDGGGAITFHRYYHVFREGELDQLIERYVENLHIISSYYDHANWCVVAEKVQVWTI